jgi:hypothetical protein
MAIGPVKFERIESRLNGTRVGGPDYERHRQG